MLPVCARYSRQGSVMTEIEASQLKKRAVPLQSGTPCLLIAAREGLRTFFPFLPSLCPTVLLPISEPFFLLPSLAMTEGLGVRAQLLLPPIFQP